MLKEETDWLKLGFILEKVVLKYPNFITEIDVTRQEGANCGSISSHIVIGADEVLLYFKKDMAIFVSILAAINMVKII